MVKRNTPSSGSGVLRFLYYLLNIECGYYPTDTSNFQEDSGNTIFKYGSTIQIEIFEGQPSFSTEAFGTISDIYGEGNYFPTGTSLITMIQTLLFEGYNVETLYYNSDGSITLEDCELILEHSGDYKPYQFVYFCHSASLPTSPFKTVSRVI